MGSIPSFIPPDVVPHTASLTLGSAVGKSGVDDSKSMPASGGFGALFAVQIGDASLAPAEVGEPLTGSHVTTENIPPALLKPAALFEPPAPFELKAEPESVEMVSSEVPSQGVSPEMNAPIPPARREIGEDIPGDDSSGQLLDLATYAVEVGSIPPAISPPISSPNTTPGGASNSVAEAMVRVLKQDPRQDSRQVTTISTVTAGLTKAPALSDVVQVGLVASDLSLFISQEPAPTSLNTIEQLPRNGRPVEAQPDRMSFFASLPPSPLQSQAQLVQTLSSSVAQLGPAPASPPAQLPMKSTIIPEAVASPAPMSAVSLSSMSQATLIENERGAQQNQDDGAPFPAVPSLVVKSSGSRSSEWNREPSLSDLRGDNAVSSVADEGLIAPAIPNLPADQPASLMRTQEPAPVSEQARMEDPLRLAEPGAGREQTASSSASSTTSAAAIPFALGAATGGPQATPTVLPNPLERNIARQLTQQLSAPLATLTTPGASRKSAADKSLIIRLTPPELGTVRIEISQRDGQLSVRMHAEDPAVRQAIERMLPTLRSDLRQADSPLQQITVESSSDTSRDSNRDSSRDSSRDSNRGADDRGSWQGQHQSQQQHQRHEHRLNGDGSRPVFSLSGMPAPEPVAAIPRSRNLGGRSSMTGVDALA